MTPLRHNCGTLYDLTKGQRVHIGDRPYIVQKQSRSGMGFLLFLELGANAPSKLSVHGLRVAIKSILPTALGAEAAGFFRRELVVWSGLQHATIVGLNEILDAGPDGAGPRDVAGEGREVRRNDVGDEDEVARL